MLITQKLAGGVSTIQSGFCIGVIEAESDENVNDLPVLLGIAPNGTVFAIFIRNQTVQTRWDCTLAKLEAVEGIKKLILKWE